MAASTRPARMSLHAISRMNHTELLDPEATGKVETLRWHNGALEMIDQRVLPMRVEYRRYDNAEGVAEAIRSMVVRGAPAIGCAAAYGVALAALRLVSRERVDFRNGLEAAFQLLGASRPTAVNLSWALARQRRLSVALAAEEPRAIANALLAEAHAIRDQDIATNRAMGAHGARAGSGRRPGAHPLQRRRAGYRGSRHRARRDPLRSRKRKAGERAGGRDPSISAGRAADMLGIDAGSDPGHADCGRRRRLADEPRGSGSGDRRRGPRCSQRRHSEQDRHLSAGRAGAASRHPVLRRVPAIHHRPLARPRRADPDRGARARGDDRLRRCPLGTGGRAGSQSGVRRDAGATGYCPDHRARRRAPPRSGETASAVSSRSSRRRRLRSRRR